jgi:hypothetical protein
MATTSTVTAIIKALTIVSRKCVVKTGSPAIILNKSSLRTIRAPINIAIINPIDSIREASSWSCFSRGVFDSSPS